MRYIDADKLIEHLKDEIKACEPVFGGRANGKSVAYGTELGLKSAISFAETLSTEDVVPKSEVEEAVKKLVGATDKVICETKTEVAREIFEEIENLFLQYYKGLTNGGELKLLKPIAHAQGFLLNELFGDISELKKNYTEGRDEG